jgi:hypothetical protein
MPESLRLKYSGARKEWNLPLLLAQPINESG